VKSRRYLFPVAVIGAIFRGKVLAGLTELQERGAVPEPPGGWPRLWKQLGAADRWVVYCKRPFAGPESVLAYLANYTHRVAISERRIERFDGQSVTFRWRDYAEDGALKHETLPVATFVRRFCQHLLPRSFTKIRHYGILANHVRKREIPQARAAIARQRRRSPRPPEPEPWQPACPHCGGTQMRCVALVQPDGRTILLPAATRLSVLPAVSRVEPRPRAPP
jgi:hypothetical protein